MRRSLLVLALLALAIPSLADDAPLCAQMLTAAELKAVLGDTFDDVPDPVLYAEGHSQCSFLAGGGKRNVMLTFLNLRAIQEGMISAESIPEYFDMNVRATEEAAATKAVPLKGAGVRAALFQLPESLVVMIETRQGFAELSTTGLTVKEVELVAKAAATASGPSR